MTTDKGLAEGKLSSFNYSSFQGFAKFTQQAVNDFTGVEDLGVDGLINIGDSNEITNKPIKGISDIDFQFSGLPKQVTLYKYKNRFNFKLIADFIDYIVGFVLSIFRVIIVGIINIIETFANYLIYVISN